MYYNILLKLTIGLINLLSWIGQAFQWLKSGIEEDLEKEFTNGRIYYNSNIPFHDPSKDINNGFYPW